MRQLLFLFILFTCGWWLTVPAQDLAPLSGTVIDKATGEPLPGATIELALASNSASKKSDIHLISGLNGSFVIRKIVAGSYEISVKYVGFARYSTVQQISGNDPKRLIIALEPGKAELTTVSVTGSRGSERASMLADRRADIVQNSQSARAIEISPDLSVANTAQRISGVSLERSTNGEGQYVIIRGMDKRYIYTLVNNIKIPSPDNKNRYVPLDLFPADMLERLEIFKSLTPNMEGDAIGGAVNMVMKDAPSKFTVNANLAAGYASRFFTEDYTKFSSSGSLDHSPRATNGNDYGATMKDFPNNAFSHQTSHNPVGAVAGLSLGGRLFENKLGVLVAGSYQNNYRDVHSVFFGTNTSQQDGSTTLSDVQQRRYSIQQQRMGLHARLDYKLNERNHLELFGAYLNLMRKEFRAQSDTNLELNRVGPGFGRVTNSYRDLHDVQQIVNTTLKGKHTLSDRLNFDWTAVYSKASLNRPDEGTLNVNAGVQKDPVTGEKVYDPNTLLSSYREFAHSSDEDKSGYLNFGYRSDVAGGVVNWSVGGMYRDKRRVSSYDKYELRPDPGGQNYDGNIGNNTFMVFNGQGTSDDALNYSANEKIGAAYGMVKGEWGSWLITGGARYEHTAFDWYSEVPVTAVGKTGSIKYYDILPSAAIKYSLSKKQAFRLSYYSAISRPNFYEAVPHKDGDADQDFRESGNPYLKRTTAENFDLRYEFFPKGLDQVLLGVFYKRLTNPIEYALTNDGSIKPGTGGQSGASGTILYYTPSNFGNANNYGAELDVTKYWRWLGIKANYTFTSSKITTTKTQNYSINGGTSQRQIEQSRPLQGQSKHIVNFSLLFKDDNHLGLNAQLAFGYTSRRIAVVSQYYNNDIWQKDFAQMDLSVEKRLARRWYVYAKVNNILNTPYQLEIRQPYTGGNAANSAPFQVQGKKTFVRKDTYGVNYLLGVKFKM